MANMAVVHLIAVLVMFSCCLAPSTGMRVLHEDAATFNATSSLSYYDGQGTYVSSDNVHRGVGYKCWSDYFVVNQGTHKGDWKKASGDQYCTAASACQIQHMDQVQVCETWSTEISVEVKSEILSFGVKSGYSFQRCLTANDVSSCTWSDGQCHCIWARPNLAFQGGYRRDRCNRGQGDRTERMVDFYHEAPYNYDYGCGSKCTDRAANLNPLATV